MKQDSAIGRFTPAAAILLVTAGITSILLADVPAPPAASKFAPAKDLLGQVDYYVEEIEESLNSEDEFTESVQKNVKKNAGTLAALALVLAKHDADNRLKKSAPALIAAAQEIAKAAGDQAKAKAQLAALKKAAGGEGAGDAPEWKPVAPLSDLMEQVESLNSKLKRNVKGSRLKRSAEKTTGYSVTLAAIAQATLSDTSAVKKKEDAEKWYRFSASMRDAAGELNAAIHKQDADAVSAAMKKLEKSCDECHEVFEDDA